MTSSLPSFSRPLWAEVDLSALRHNAQVLATHVAPARLWCIIKAGAYGHGAVEVAATLKSEPFVAGFGVASVDEGFTLRESGITKPILLLSAILPEEATAVAEARLTPTVWTTELASRLQAEAEKRQTVLPVHFKVDTGMSRLGVAYTDATARWAELQGFDRLRIEGIYTHMACADEPDEAPTLQQLARFKSVLSKIAPAPSILRHAANSAATLRFPQAHLDTVRPGLALYGVHPCPGFGPELDLRPVMTWKARVAAVKSMPAGTNVSYGAAWQASQSSRIAVIPVGYADGYSRNLSNRAEVSVNGQRFPVIGCVTMDQTLVDVTDAARPVHIGDEVTLFGPNLLVEEVAARANTIPWESLCAVSRRVPRVHLNTTSA